MWRPVAVQEGDGVRVSDGRHQGLPDLFEQVVELAGAQVAVYVLGVVDLHHQRPKRALVADRAVHLLAQQRLGENRVEELRGRVDHEDGTGIASALSVAAIRAELGPIGDLPLTGPADRHRGRHSSREYPNSLTIDKDGGPAGSLRQ